MNLLRRNAGKYEENMGGGGRDGVKEWGGYYNGNKGKDFRAKKYN